ncbi:MAG TPA: TAXI family TRAP transporter solute-binding subunit [Burkholderiales bacterium]|jgi:TRAP transporter TAXI family solute receptor|nr:TAXI family TRAP transporter solute-binding subunit [Burkholderiales bacterium]
MARLVALLASLLASAALAQARPSTHWPKTLTLATGSLGATYVVYGQAWADLVNAKLGTHIAIQQTDGPVQNVALTDGRLTDFGMTTMGVAIQSWQGRGEWTRGRPQRNFRAMFPMYDTPFHFVALEKSGIRQVRDLNGRKAGVGPRGGTCGAYIPPIFKILGIEATIRHGQAADMAASLQDGLIEAFPFCAGVPVGAYSDLEAVNKVRFFTFTRDEIRRIKAAFPELSEAIIPKGAYRQLREDQLTVGVFNFAIAHKDLPEDLVYEITKAVLESQPQLVKAHPAAKETVLENWRRNAVIPFHPGALRYYKEKGISVPASLKPASS